MKKLVVAILCLTASSPALAEWRWAGGANDHSAVVFVQTDSVRRSGSDVQFWEETRAKVPLPDGTDRMMQLVSTDCGSYRWSFLSLTTYKGSNSVTTSSVATPPKYAAPESTMYGVIKQVCSGDYVIKEPVDRDAFTEFFFNDR